MINHTFSINRFKVVTLAVAFTLSTVVFTMSTVIFTLTNVVVTLSIVFFYAVNCGYMWFSAAMAKGFTLLTIVSLW